MQYTDNIWLLDWERIMQSRYIEDNATKKKLLDNEYLYGSLHSLSIVWLHRSLSSSTCRKRNCWRSEPEREKDGWYRYSHSLNIVHSESINTPRLNPRCIYFLTHLPQYSIMTKWKCYWNLRKCSENEIQKSNLHTVQVKSLNTHTQGFPYF